jgi:hypothetical protein
MCDSNVGVAKALDLEKISKEIADLVQGIDDEVSVEVSDIKRIQKELEDVIKKGKP